MAIETYTFSTSMGKVRTYFEHPLHFLSEQEKEEFNKSNNKESYLNSLNKGEFSLVQTKWDNGDFSEEFVLSRYFN